MLKSKIKAIYRFCICHYWGKKGFTNKGRLFGYLESMKKAEKETPLPKKQIKWAKKRGFYPYRIWQYGLTEENYRNVISDWDYEYLAPINNRYRDLIVNKLKARYTLAPFSQHFPKYYYHLMHDRDVMRLMDCPKECEASLDGVIHLIRAIGIVACKKTDGLHGIGFYKIKAVGNGFEANGKHFSEDEFRTFLKGLHEYIITEYITMHPDIAKLNPTSVNTIRVTAINEHGNDPIIPFAFLRIGTQKSGTTDNVSAGGMVCKINVESGWFYDGETLKNHVYSKAPVHPDTNEKLEGIIPHWESVKSGIIDVCNYLPQVEWFGFDIAITPESFMIVEINSMQDMQKANEYPDAVMGFLFRKLKKKKAKYGLKD